MGTGRSLASLVIQPSMAHLRIHASMAQRQRRAARRRRRLETREGLDQRGGVRAGTDPVLVAVDLAAGPVDGLHVLILVFRFFKKTCGYKIASVNLRLIEAPSLEPDGITVSENLVFVVVPCRPNTA